MEETYEQQMKDSDMIFTQITTAYYDNFEEARRAIVLFYVPDMSISRAGIAHALKRVEDYFVAQLRRDLAWHKNRIKQGSDGRI
jgi:hypothetical protein